MNYLLITPVKNESNNIPSLFNSILNQTIKPIIWVIIDGNSKDDTKEKIIALIKENNWIYLQDQKKYSKVGPHCNFAFAVMEGFEVGDRLCREKHYEYKYIGKLDADVLIPSDFFEKLIKYMDINLDCAVTSATSYTIHNNKIYTSYESVEPESIIIDRYLLDELPDKRLYRKEDIDNIGGFPIAMYSPDTIVLTKFRLNNKKICKLNDLKLINCRNDTGIERNMIISYFNFGKAKYYLNYSWILFFFSFISVSLRYPYYNCLPYFLGYLYSYIMHDKQIDDDKIKQYFAKKRLKELIFQHTNAVVGGWI